MTAAGVWQRRAAGKDLALTGRQAIRCIDRQRIDLPHRGRVVRSFQAPGSEGIDISANVGDPVLAAGAGDVVYSGRGVQGSGNLIIIRHSDRYLSAYAHNSAMLLPEGSHVEAGDKIAEAGSNPAGVPMLHFEIRRDGKSIDPMQYLPQR